MLVGVDPISVRLAPSDYDTRRDERLTLPDFEKYTLLNTISSTQIDLSEGKRLIFIGDIHGSLAPLERLMSQINYHPANDRLIHVGDLIAKGDMNDEVLVWMNRRRIQGVRGNHDQPVIQWRTWMEWAGGEDWEGFVDGLGENGDEEVLSVLSNAGKMYPKDWEWKGEHWKIARWVGVCVNGVDKE